MPTDTRITHRYTNYPQKYQTHITYIIKIIHGPNLDSALIPKTVFKIVGDKRLTVSEQARRLVDYKKYTAIFRRRVAAGSLTIILQLLSHGTSPESRFVTSLKFKCYVHLWTWGWNKWWALTKCVESRTVFSRSERSAVRLFVYWRLEHYHYVTLQKHNLTDSFFFSHIGN